MPAPRPQADRDHMIELYRSGMTMKEIAQRFNTHKTVVGKVIRRAGISRLPTEYGVKSRDKATGDKRFRTDVDLQQVAKRYLAGEPQTAIAQDLQVCHGTIKRWLKEMGIPIRSYAETRLLIEREQASATIANSRSRRIGWGEELLYQWLIERGETPDRQRPEGVKNIDIALHPIAVEIWLSSSSPLTDTYCRERIKYLAERGWSSLYIFISRRTRVLLPCVADEIIARYNFARSNPTAIRQHWVIRGCGEVAATFGDDLNHGPLIPPSIDCLYHSTVNESITG